MRKAVSLACFLFATTIVAELGAGQAPAQRATGVVEARATAVLVDVVVRDKRGEPVRDLNPSDFELLEDGVAQKIASFTPTFDGVPAPTAPALTNPASPASGATSGPSPSNRPNITALVFDRLSPDARRLAVQAARNYMGNKEETPDYYGVFSVDLALTPYSSFTRNARVLRNALDKMGSRASSSFVNPDEQQRRQNLEQQAATAGQATAPSSSGGPGGAPTVGTAAGDALLAQMEARMIQGFERMARDEQGYSTINGLFAVIDGMRTLPGRKSLVFFSEGVAIPPAVHRLFLGVIDAANRANVSIYTMDAAGLRAESEQAKIRDAVNQAGRRGIETGYTSAGSGTSSAPLTQDLETNEGVLRQDPRTSLGGLAQSTGGLLFESTNNLRQGFERIESDLRNYYLLGYTPANENYDGHFRTIDVKVSRPGVTVAARKGYFAVRDPGGAAVNSWEAPALGALEMRPVPNAFPVRALALSFPERDRPGLVPVVVDVKTAPLSFTPSADGKTYTSDFAVLVRFLGPQNEIVSKVGQHYEIRGPIAEMDRARQGEVLFYREPDLTPGVYTMEAIVYDSPTGKASVRFATVEVPKVDVAALRMGPLVLIGRAEKVAEKDRRKGNPLLVNDVVVYPNLGDPVSRKANEVGFFFTVYPAAGGARPEATLQLVENEKVLAESRLPLEPADASGRIQQTGRLPIQQLGPRTYELRVLVRQGTTQVARSTLLRVVD